MLAPGYSRGRGGFTMIELMITVAIVGIALALGVPAFSAWMQDTQVRTVAESIRDGLTKAKNTALGRGDAVAEFSLNTDTSWKVTLRVSGIDTIVEQRAMTEGSSTNVTATLTPAGASGKVTFNSLMRVVDASPITQVDVQSAKGTKTLRITIDRGGATKMCDPDPAISSSDPRYCL
jgi:type IV fimbrial biogenesis protein FimT